MSTQDWPSPVPGLDQLCFVTDEPKGEREAAALAYLRLEKPDQP